MTKLFTSLTRFKTNQFDVQVFGFNQITVLQQANPAVKAQIQAELMRLQQSGNQ